MFSTNDWASDDLGIIIPAVAILTIVSISQVERLLDDGDWTELAKIMAPRLEFGTAGIRGRMGAGFGRMNDLVIIQVYKCAWLCLCTRCLFPSQYHPFDYQSCFLWSKIFKC